jgi:hypothetical protein
MQTQMEIPQFPLPICGNSLIFEELAKMCARSGNKLVVPEIGPE